MPLLSNVNRSAFLEGICDIMVKRIAPLEDTSLGGRNLGLFSNPVIIQSTKDNWLLTFSDQFSYFFDGQIYCTFGVLQDNNISVNGQPR